MRTVTDVKKAKKIGIITAAVLAAAAAAAGIIMLVRGNTSSGKGYDGVTKITDMNDPSPAGDFGAIYYTPAEEKHIKRINDSLGGYTDNEILLTVKEGVSREDAEKLAESISAKIVGEIALTGDYQLRLDKALSESELAAVAEKLRSDPKTENASLNYTAEVAGTSEKYSDFYVGKEWQEDFDSTKDSKVKNWGFEMIHAKEAWSYMQKNSLSLWPVNVGLIDGGMDIDHEDLKFVEVFYDNGMNGVNVDAENKRHGTHVAGTMAADCSDTTGICGVYPYGSGRLYGVCSCGSIGAAAYNTSVMAEKISYAELIVRNVKVINVSLGYDFQDEEGWEKWYNDENYYKKEKKWLFEGAELLADFFERMLAKGYDFVIVNAAGNESTGLSPKFDCRFHLWEAAITRDKHPDVYDRIIEVGAVNLHFQDTDYSNGGERIDIKAPGGDGYGGIFSTVPGSRYSNMASDDPGEHLIMGGTSMAAPHVSGVAAMVWTVNKELTGAQVKEIMKNSCSSDTGVISALLAVMRARDSIKGNGFGKPSAPDNGGVLCYVVDKEDEAPISGASVTLTDISSSEIYTGTTDEYGHFEIMVPDGKYTLKVTASGYLDYDWPDGNNYENPITVKSKNIRYLDDWIKMTRVDAVSQPDSREANSQPEYDYSEPEGSENEHPRSGGGDIHSGSGGFGDILGGVYSSYNYGVDLFGDIAAWRVYNGHLYAIYDYAVSPHLLNLVTQIDKSSHLVTVTDSAEQRAVEELIEAGNCACYYTGEMVDKNGRLFCVSGEKAGYSNWMDGLPEYKADNEYNVFALIYRGSESPASLDPDFGKWFDATESVYSYLDVFYDLEGLSCGLILEWDNPAGIALDQ